MYGYNGKGILAVVNSDVYKYRIQKFMMKAMYFAVCGQCVLHSTELS